MEVMKRHEDKEDDKMEVRLGYCLKRNRIVEVEHYKRNRMVEEACEMVEEDCEMVEEDYEKDRIVKVDYKKNKIEVDYEKD